MVKETESGLDIIQPCSDHASHWVEDVEFESVIAVWASVFALKINHAQLVAQCIYTTALTFYWSLILEHSISATHIARSAYTTWWPHTQTAIASKGHRSKSAGKKLQEKSHRIISPQFKKPPGTKAPRIKMPLTQKKPKQKAPDAKKPPKTICSLLQIAPCYELMMRLCWVPPHTPAHSIMWRGI